MPAVTRRTPKRSTLSALSNASQLVTRVDELSGRFDTTAAEHRYLNERIDTVENNLFKKIETETGNISQHIDKLGDRLEANLNALDKRVSVLERWRWFIVGGAAVVLFALSNYFIRMFLLK